MSVLLTEVVWHKFEQSEPNLICALRQQSDHS